ncbi:MAG: Smr/MutS family protein [Betaproteobacteria bacterium]|nr:Smr/MutS family protein [Betaproteobacteria bacterium]
MPDKTPLQINSLDEASIFRNLMQDVRPLADAGRIAPEVVLPKQQAKSRIKEVVELDGLTDSMAGLKGRYDPETGVFARSGLQKEVLRRLRRDYWGVQAELDLHGLTRDAARTSLVRFLEHCGHQHIRCVRIIHGKGMNSPDGLGVLRQLLPAWLAQRDAVLAFCPAPPSDGGSGAVVVLLKIV